MKCPNCGEELKKLKPLGEEVITFTDCEGEGKAKFSFSLGNKSGGLKVIYGSVKRAGFCKICNKIYGEIE